ncbi:MAG: hypothetical protein ACI8ZB_000410 [Desulforhopalus sp.]|jgi:hypothetical protein
MSAKEILSHLHTFFPKSSYSFDNLAEYVERDELDTSPESLANTLKGALLDETILEVQLHDLKDVFFCRILDNPFDESLTDEDGNFTYQAADYETGSYLDYHEHLFITPLEPSRGNFFISALQELEVKVLLRIISSGNAIEFGTFFEHRTLVGDMPSLKVTFPLVAKKTAKARELRVKVPKDMKIQVTIERVKKKPILTTPLNISLNGMSLFDPMERRSNLQIGEKIVCNIQVPREEIILVEASVIHVTNLRDSEGVQYCFGIKFQLNNQAIKSAIEKVMALVQRKHLRELSDIEEKFGVFFDK